MSREHLGPAAAVFALAAAVRFAILPLIVDLPIAADEGYYWWFSGVFDRDVDYAVLRPPLWSHLVWLTKAVFGEPIAVRALSALLGAATVPLVYLLGARVCDRRVGLGAAVGLALYPVHIGYSHYLWAEACFGFLLVLSTLLFFGFLENGRTRTLLLGALACSLAVLVKVFAGIVFVAFVVTALLQGFERKLARLALAGLVFVLPIAGYSVYASNLVGRRVIVSETGVFNLRQAVGLDESFDYQPDLRDEKAAELYEHLLARSPARTLADASTQFANLWTPSTYATSRVLPDAEWNRASLWTYGLPLWAALPLAIVTTAAYVFLVVLGVTGLCLGRSSPFRTFSILTLLGLCGITAVAYLTSRFRLSFMWLLVLHASVLIQHPRACFAALPDPRRLVPLVLLLGLFAFVVLSKLATIGAWG
jgi:4-amino-4-deoxy-L-arabinose transferase-like glycosyltransferase